MSAMIVQCGEQKDICNLGGKENFCWRDWSSELKEVYLNLNGILSFQYFMATIEDPGVIYYKALPDDPWEKKQLLRTGKQAYPGLPKKIMPEGLSKERQKYLYDNIRQHVLDENLRDYVCPPLPKIE
eukprot:GCRY01003536.1.p2 GENE.GCRY01003536.1~~GCRY01003536.1.p2  ORF type:complete len:127 (-),score=10.98 GCRY01003536.1:114-494(-)